MRAIRSIPVAYRVALCAVVSIVFVNCPGPEPEKEEARKPESTDFVYVDTTAVLPMKAYLPGTKVICPNVASGPLGDVGPATHKDTLSIALADSIAAIPEFHDCQRVLVHVRASKGRTASLQYGPLIGLWASAALSRLEDVDFNKQVIPTVQVVNYNDVQYAELGIGHGHNCLYIRAQGSTWSAGMKKQDLVNACPVISDADFAGLTQLAVIRRLVTSQFKDSIPPVARWDWDSVAERHTIGVKCGRAWCEVGRATMHSSTSYSSTSATSHIKGWYDEQNLAVLPSGRLTPGHRARLIPVPGLDTLKADDFHCTSPCPAKAGKWVDVASALYSGAGDPSYELKMNLRPGKRAQVAMRSRDSLGTVLWQSRIISDGDTAYKKVLRVDHHGFKIPGTARWFWREDDEMMWVKCLAGCCAVTSDDS